MEKQRERERERERKDTYNIALNVTKKEPVCTYRCASTSHHPDKTSLASLCSQILCKCVKEFCLKPGLTSTAILRVALASLSDRMEKAMVTGFGLQIVTLVRIHPACEMAIFVSEHCLLLK